MIYNFRNKHFDKIYTSDLKRAKQTAEAVIPDCTYEETTLLREINVGALEGKTFKYLQETYGEDFKKNRANMDFSPYGGESAEEFMNRVKQFMNKMEQSEEDAVVAFSHGGFLRTVVRYVFNQNVSISCANCTIGIFEFENGKWSLNSWINPSEL